MYDDLQEILVTEEQIRDRVRSLGDEITQLYAAAGELTVIAIINGALLFTADLIRHIRLPVRVDCMRVSSYMDGVRPMKVPEIIDNLRLDCKGRHVLVIDDILDTGNTMIRVLDAIRSLQPASLRFAVLLSKTGCREVALEADLSGFTIPNAFVVGYGLDFAEQYRHLPCIGTLKPECQNPPAWR
jgi:hypoxanthine phosphoribosyltransferase